MKLVEFFSDLVCELVCCVMACDCLVFTAGGLDEVLIGTAGCPDRDGPIGSLQGRVGACMPVLPCLWFSFGHALECCA